MAIKVSDEIIVSYQIPFVQYWMLPEEFVSCRFSSSQFLPKDFLGFGHIFSEFTGMVPDTAEIKIAIFHSK
jgi:hypothetical protein